MSSSDYYLSQLLQKQKPTTEQKKLTRNTSNRFVEIIRQGTNEPMIRFYFVGSYAKGTTLKDIYDLNLVVCYPHITSKSLEGIYNKIREILQKEGFNHWAKSVALRCNLVDKKFGNYYYDIIPAKTINSNFYNVDLYNPRKHTPVRTSVRAHVEAVQKARHRYAIKFLKLWRRRYDFTCPTFILEMLFLKYISINKPREMHSLLKGVFKYIADSIATTVLIDPANAQNIVSNQLSHDQKQQIQYYAQKAYDAKHWSDVFEK
ncbi:MAG: hypothetical protein ACFFCZ_20465 [Promethearchaeota archaeon]